MHACLSVFLNRNKPFKSIWTSNMRRWINPSLMSTAEDSPMVSEKKEQRVEKLDRELKERRREERLKERLKEIHIYIYTYIYRERVEMDMHSYMKASVYQRRASGNLAVCLLSFVLLLFVWCDGWRRHERSLHVHVHFKSFHFLFQHLHTQHGKW